MNKWDVVVLSYPFSDLSATKVRPALVVSSDSYNQNSQDAVFILITSNISRRGPFDVAVAKTHPEFALSGLRFDSAVRIDKITTLNKRLAAATIGRFGPKLAAEVEKKLRLFLELPGEQLALKI
jgi:mRNA interferase MazF